MSSARSDRLVLALFLLLVVVPVAASLAYAALYSVGLVGLLAPGLTSAFVGRLLRDPETWTSLRFSLVVAVSVVALTTVIALPLSIALRQRLRRGVLAYAVTLPLAIPGVVAGFLGTQWLGGSGLVSRIAFRFGLIHDPSQFPALIQDPWGLGIVFAHAALAVPFFLLLFAEIHASEGVDALCEQARMLGASQAQTLRRVTAPLLLQRARPALALLFVAVMVSFEIPLILGGQHPQMVSVVVFRKYALFDVTRKPDAYALALASTLMAMAIAALGPGGRRSRDHA